MLDGRVVYCMFIAIVLILLLIIAVNDFLFFRIEDSVNIAVVSLFGIGWLFGLLHNYSIVSALSVASFCFVVSVVLNYFELLGGGDVKLLFGVGLFISGNPSIFLYALSISSLIIATAYIYKGKEIEIFRKKMATIVINNKTNRILNKILFPSAYNISEVEFLNFKQNACALKQEIPYGVILSFSTISAILVNAMSIGGV